MKVVYTSASGRLSFEFEVQTGKAAFEAVAAIQELFEEPDCGMCKGKRIKCDCREFDGNKYFKLACDDCGAQLDFGQHKDGKGLFIKRKDKDNRAIPNRGWYKWQAK